MEVRPLEIKIISATDLKNVNTFSKMDVYVTVSITGDPRSVQRSPVDKDGGTSPNWKNSGHLMKFIINETATQHAGISIQLMSDRTLGDKEIGRVYIPLKELFDAAAAVSNSKEGGTGDYREVEYKVRRPSGRVQGTINFTYRFGEKYAQKSVPVSEPVMAYPAGGVGTSEGAGRYPVPGGGGGYYPQGSGVAAAYPPPPGVGGYHHQYPPPQQQSYPYPPPPPPQYGYNYGQGTGYGYGYGQPPMMAPAQKPNRGRFGMGSAAMGLGAGLLGGLLVGEMVEDVAEAAAFDDYGGYDGGDMFDM